MQINSIHTNALHTNSLHSNSMQVQETNNRAANNHVTLELIDRQMLRLTGVNNVDVFDEEQIVLQTELGKLEINGYHLNVTNLDVENGDLQVDGIINSFVYLEEKQKYGAKGKTMKNRPLKSTVTKNKAKNSDGLFARLFS